MSYRTTYLQKRGFSLNFRIAIPRDLRHTIGVREIVKVLPTQDRCIAGSIALSLAAQAKQLFIRLRGMAKHNKTNNDNPIFGYTLEFDLDESGATKRLKVQAEPHEEDAVNSAIRTAIESGVTARNKSQALPTSTTAAESSSVAIKSAHVPTFHQVIDRFLDEYPKTKSPSMYKKHIVALPMLREFVGDIPVTELRQAHINDFFTLLQRLPPRWKDQCRRLGLTIRKLAELDHPEKIAPKTFDDSYKASIRPFLDDAVTNWQDSGFPTTLSLKATKYKGERKEGEKKQRHFKQAELQRLFEGNEMKSFASGSAKSHCYLLPHIGLFTGARVNEICQLNPQTDILKDPETGIWYFWITEETEGDERIDKRTKNNESRRKVPIHSKLIELGILDYINVVKKQGAKMIFPAWKPSRGRASSEAEKWFRKLITEAGLRDETKGARIVGFHAFRHTLENKGENTKGLPWAIEHITGHAIPGKSKVSKGYSGELDLKNKQEIIEAINFDLKFLARDHVSRVS